MTDSKAPAKKPFEIAREALMQLTARKLVPTPLNYQAVKYRCPAARW